MRKRESDKERKRIGREGESLCCAFLAHFSLNKRLHNGITSSGLPDTHKGSKAAFVFWFLLQAFPLISPLFSL